MPPRSRYSNRPPSKRRVRLIDGDGARRRLGLQTRREIRRLADDRLLLGGARSDQVTDDDEPRGDADAALQGRAGRQPGDACDELQRRPYRPLRVILMGLRITEDRRAHRRPYTSRRTRRSAATALGDALLVGGDDLAQVLGIHTRGKCCRTDEVREHHGDLTAFGSVLSGLRKCRGSGRRRRVRRLFRT